MIHVKPIKNSQICYEANPSPYIAEYYNYCLKLLENELYKIEIPLNIIFGNLNWNFENQNRILKIDIKFLKTNNKSVMRPKDIKKV